ncbi:MAG: DUF4292 domain-containing protein [bacterium]
MRETTRRVSLALVSALILSCAPRAVIPPPLPPEGITSAYLIEKISYDRIDTLSAALKIRVYREEESFAYVTGALNYRRPNLLASSLFGPFGVTVMRMLITEDTVGIYLPDKDALYTGSLQIPSLLPDSQTLKGLRSDVIESNDDYILAFYSGGSGESVMAGRYFFNKKTLETHLIEKYNGNRVLFKIMIEETGPENVPSRFSILAGDKRFAVALENIRINAAIPEAAFSALESDRVLPLQELLRSLAPRQ